MSARVYLQSFHLPDRGEEKSFLRQIKRTCYPDRYPFNVFRYREMPVFTLCASAAVSFRPAVPPGPLPGVGSSPATMCSIIF